MLNLLYEGTGGWFAFNDLGAAAMQGNDGVVLLVDGDEGSRSLAAAALTRAGYEAVEVSTGSAALDLVRANGVAIVVLEVILDDMTGYEVCREIRGERPDLPIFFLSGIRTEPFDRVAGLLLGADDFIVKPFDGAELVARVRRFVGRNLPPQREVEVGRNRKPNLTDREHEILALLAEGRRQKEIAIDLAISQKTVASHIQNLLGKFDVHSRAELVAQAYLLGLVASGVGL